MPMVQPSSPPKRASLHVQKLGRRKTVVIAPQMLSAVGFKPAPKSRTSATWCASTLTTASVIAPTVALTLALAPTVALTLTVVLARIQVELSEHAVLAGHEKRASMQRTARGRGEHACTMPAPVALLMHVWSGAHEMPLPQSLLGITVGIAETPQHITATMNNAAFTFMCIGIVVFVLRVVLFLLLFVIFIRA
jgi:hypothetical protein